jgi:hypothetical protein
MTAFIQQPAAEYGYVGAGRMTSAMTGHEPARPVSRGENGHRGATLPVPMDNAGPGTTGRRVTATGDTDGTDERSPVLGRLAGGRTGHTSRRWSR